MTHPDNREQYGATLHDCTRRVSHPDSEEAVQIECQRAAQELQPFEYRFESGAISSTCRQRQEDPSRTRQISHISSNASNAPLQCRVSLDSYASTQPGVTCSQGSSVRAVYWYSPVERFWTLHVRYVAGSTFLASLLTRYSLTIEEGAHRDHLGIHHLLAHDTH